MFRLLERQIKQYLGENVVLSNEWLLLLNAISRSYEHYEQSHALDLRALELSSKEAHEEQEKRFALQKELIDLAHQVGMAEVAASVLHNVGNVLNSINTSSELIREIIKSSEMENFAKLSDLLQEHKNNLPQFFFENTQGKHVLEYLLVAGNTFKKEYQQLTEEINRLSVNVEHIKNIIKMQQSVSGPTGIVELVSFSCLIEEALSMFKGDYEHVTVERYYQPVSRIFLERVRVIQILVNLIRNAFQAVEQHQASEKKVIQLSFRLLASDNPEIHLLEFHCADNGCGIAPDQLLKIFSYGYSTKRDGHGFGLHASALSAQEMGGSLTVQSEGVGKGAVFTLTLPCRFEKE